MEKSLTVNQEEFEGMFCINCAAKISREATACPACGHPCKNLTNASPKSLLVAVLLCFFLGSLGIHRFYVGKIGTGILMLITLGLFGIWTLIDFIILLTGNFKDSNGKVLSWK